MEMTKKRDKTEIFETMPVPKALAVMAIPTIISQVVTMVYGGLVNKNIVAGLQARGTNALGLTGADCNIVHAHKRPVKDIDWGFVGDVDGADGKMLAALIAQGIVPVVAPLTHDGNGNMLNINADTMADGVAFGFERCHMTMHSMFFCPRAHQGLIAITFISPQTKVAMSNGKILRAKMLIEQVGQTHRIHASADSHKHTP